MINRVELDILYQDNHLIAVNKLPGQLVQGDKTGDKPLNQMVKDYLKQKYNKPGNVFLGVIHRLDRPASGVVLFARNSKALARMNKNFKNKEIKKVYWAIVKNPPPHNHDTLNNHLFKNQAKNKSYVTEKNQPGTKAACLTYRIILKLKRYTVLQITPQSGRHHQIRVQLAAIGCPIKGDIKYGFARTNTDASIHLHARELRFLHPVTKKEVVLIATPPLTDPLWQGVMEQL
jgi:23S rRNA pseudouridine1911/1915/1917 synthase